MTSELLHKTGNIRCPYTHTPSFYHISIPLYTLGRFNWSYLNPNTVNGTVNWSYHIFTSILHVRLFTGTILWSRSPRHEKCAFLPVTFFFEKQGGKGYIFLASAWLNRELWDKQFGTLIDPTRGPHHIVIIILIWHAGGAENIKMIITMWWGPRVGSISVPNCLSHNSLLSHALVKKI